jgi:hypothetical protein
MITAFLQDNTPLTPLEREPATLNRIVMQFHSETATGNFFNYINLNSKI